MRRDDEHRCSSLKAHTTFDTDDGVTHVHVASYAVRRSNLFNSLNSLYAIIVGLSVHTNQFAILKLEYDILLAVFGDLLEVCCFR